jgi:hypothetical protein
MVAWKVGYLDKILVVWMAEILAGMSAVPLAVLLVPTKVLSLAEYLVVEME